MFAVIQPDGALTIDERPVTMELVEEAVGPEGWNRAYPRADCRMVGWLNDCGLLMPEKYPRNEVGGAVLAAMGAPQQPYAGPVVITGYDHGGSGGWPLDLDELRVQAQRALHAAVRSALAGEPDDLCPFGPDWAAEIRRFATQMRTEQPRIEIREL